MKFRTKAKKVMAFVLTLILALQLIPIGIFTAGAETLASSVGSSISLDKEVYATGDVAVINAIIANNGLDWTLAEPAGGKLLAIYTDV